MLVVPFCLGARPRAAIISLCNTTFLVLTSWPQLASETTHRSNAAEISTRVNKAHLSETLVQCSSFQIRYRYLTPLNFNFKLK